MTVRCMFLFLSTPSARRATAALVPICGMRRNFYPRPPRGGRPAKARKVFQGHTLSIHALREEGDPGVRHCPPGDADFYPRPPRGGRRNPQQGDTISKPISIHALREEGDCGVSELVRRAGNFYPRPPRGGRRSKKYSASGTWQFLSTPSARRATSGPLNLVTHDLISIHALREEGDHRVISKDLVAVPISIHALREEGDQSCTLNLPCYENFYPRPPRGGRQRGALPTPLMRYFYPRPPRGGRHEYLGAANITVQFLSTPSARRATDPRVLLQRARTISIHALREEGDPARTSMLWSWTNFYPRPPRGGRPS